MEDRDKIELLAVFAAGALIGVGATLLLRPGIPEPVLERLKHTGRELQRRARRTARDAEARGGKLARTSRRLLDDFRGEASEIVGAAREELARHVYSELRGGRGASRPRGRRLKR